MTSEVCPFCGKTYKRLKSHLPHCKAAANKTLQTEHNVKTNQTTPQPVAGSSEPTAKGEKSTPMSAAASPPSKRSAKASSTRPHTSSPRAPPKSANASSSSSPASVPSSTKMKKQKLSEQIKMAATPASTTTSLVSPSALSPSSTIPKPKKKSLHALIEAAKSDHDTKGPPEGTRSASGDLPPGLDPSLTDPAKPRTKAQTETNIIPDDASFAPLSTDTLPKHAPAKKASKTERAAQSLPPTEDDEVLGSDIKESGERDDRVDNDRYLKDLLLNRKSRSGHQAKITIQDIKATLGRVKTSSQSRILSQSETTDNLSSKTRLDKSVSLVTAPAEKQKDALSCLVETKTQSDQLPSPTTSQRPQPQSITEKSSESKVSALNPPQHNGSSQPKLGPGPTLLSGHLSSQVGLNEGLKVGRHMTEVASVPLSHIQFSCPHLPRALAARVEPARVEPARVDDRLKPEDGKQNAAHGRTEGAVAQRRLGQVRLRELPEWLACKTPGHPRDVVEMAQTGWHWYYRKYINVKKGGVGGLGMLLAGYCVLSYIWRYPHIKHDRWRKYH